MGGSGAGPVLTTFVIIGGVFAFWFYTSSHFIQNGVLDFSKSSIMPVYCEISSDRAADVKVTAEAYVWQNNIRIYVYRKSSALITENKTSSVENEIVTPNDTGYIWFDGADSGEKDLNVKTFPLLDNVSSTNSWFCWPWFLLDYSKFELPKGVKFE